MFCCLDFGTTDFPANRKREGNYQHTYAAPAADIGDPLSHHETVSVTVPYNKYGGEEISVKPPKSGKSAIVIIPHALRPGDKFLVDIPVVSEEMIPNYEGQIMSVPAPSAPPKDDVNHSDTIFSTHSNTTSTDCWAAESSLPKYSSPVSTPFLQPLHNGEMTSYGKRRLLVKVPPGVAPGMTIEIKIPEENNRIMQVKVPRNAKEFYVEYEPMNPKFIGSTENGGGLDSTVRTVPTKRENGIDEAIIPIIGGAALLGTAGFLIGHHNNGN
jgi:hypothetical protein